MNPFNIIGGRLQHGSVHFFRQEIQIQKFQHHNDYFTSWRELTSLQTQRLDSAVLHWTTDLFICNGDCIFKGEYYWILCKWCPSLQYTILVYLNTLADNLHFKILFWIKIHFTLMFQRWCDEYLDSPCYSWSGERTTSLMDAWLVAGAPTAM